MSKRTYLRDRLKRLRSPRLSLDTRIVIGVLATLALTGLGWGLATDALMPEWGKWLFGGAMLSVLVFSVLKTVWYRRVIDESHREYPRYDGPNPKQHSRPHSWQRRTQQFPPERLGPQAPL